jgi:rRNA processing protein Krr1/Pno1
MASPLTPLPPRRPQGHTGYGDANASADPSIDPPAMVVAAEPVQAQDGTSWTVVLDVSTKMIGRLIGKEGATIQHLEGSTGTRIQIDQKTPGEYKKVHVTGTREALDFAQSQIQAALDAESGPGVGDITKSTVCPPGIVGRIIGRNGETIKSLQTASGAHIVVDQTMPPDQDRVINVNGRAEAVDRAMKMIEELIKGEPGSATAIIQKVGIEVGGGGACGLARPTPGPGRGGQHAQAGGRRAALLVGASRAPLGGTHTASALPCQAASGAWPPYDLPPYTLSPSLPPLRSMASAPTAR